VTRSQPTKFLVAIAAACGCGSAKPDPDLPVKFPDGFRYGVATIAYQSEGTIQAGGGRVVSNWSQWEDLGKVENAQHNDRGNGFFDRYDVDLDLAKQMNANAFSYSLDWARIEPQPGVFDDAEAARAVQIISDMRARGLRPMVVLFHWVTPAWVQSPISGVDMLSSPDDSFVNAFLPFIDHMVPMLADQVDDWVTFEEPVSILLGEYLVGEHPPGKVFDFADGEIALKNLMYMSARTYQHVHQLDTVDADNDGTAAWVGMENLAVEVVPLSKSAADADAAKHVDYLVNQQFLNGVVHGDIDLDLDGVAESHDDSIANTLDFIGLNYYQRARVEAGGIYGHVAPLNATPHYDVRDYDPTIPHGDDYAEISASGERVEIEAYSKYGLPMMITENGMADADDDQRPYYTLQHLYEIGNAIRDGYDVRGYFHWTISDNFEWAYGIDLKEGMYQVNFTDPSFPRTPTNTVDLFTQIGAAHGIDKSIWSQFALSKYPVGIP
jgi:beta-glucosidase/6-phospho-beta-glucosidase/beta-galactosidase